MSTWTARAKVAISQKGPSGTAKTDETLVLGLSSVSSVPTGAVCQTPYRHLTVLKVPFSGKLEELDVEPSAKEPAVTNTKQVESHTLESKPIFIGTVRPPGLSPKLLAASIALDAYIAATMRSSEKK